MTANNSVKQYDFTGAEVAKLFAMQDLLNSYIHPEWQTQKFNWGLAILDECMEIHGHLGWKWWKQGYQAGLTEENRKQIQLEVIDILHFVVSDWTVRDWAKYGLENLNDLACGYGLSYCVEHMIKEVTNGRTDVIFNIWINMAHSVGLTKKQILETYTQKYVLNKFRQDNGYKTGEYAKIWHFDPESVMFAGQSVVTYIAEDNYWLEDVVHHLKSINADTTDEILLYNELQLLYNSRLNKS